MKVLVLVPVQHSARGEQHESVSYGRYLDRLIRKGKQLQLSSMRGLPVIIQVEDCCHTPPIELFITIIVQGKATPTAFSHKSSCVHCHHRHI